MWLTIWGGAKLDRARRRIDAAEPLPNDLPRSQNHNLGIAGLGPRGKLIGPKLQPT